MLEHANKIACPECNGTGASKPKCWLCDGERIITIALALKEGWTESDLEEVYDGECDCPSCHGDACDLCDGEGKVSPETLEIEVTRVLLFGLNQCIPPRYYRDHWGRERAHDDLLCTFAAAICRDRGWIRWFTSIFGDEVYLTDAGEAEARKRAAEWARARDSNLAPHDDFGRWNNESGAPQYAAQDTGESNG